MISISFPYQIVQGGTRGIGFIHSPLLAKSGYTSTNLMHAVDWLPTLLSAVGRADMETSARDGVDQWKSLADTSVEKPRNEIVYNVKEKPFMAAIRYLDPHHQVVLVSFPSYNL